jgi:glycosyltransferase involved in cell wall biosynthesis
MKVLLSLTYYRPHISGLTVYAQRLAEGLAAGGAQVTVLTSQHAKSLPLEETLGGVRVVRLPVSFRISKGVVMPSILKVAAPWIRRHDVVSVHLPCTPAEALVLPLMARRLGRPIVATYHCDLRLPPGLLNRLIDAGIRSVNLLSGLLVDRIVAYTEDYAEYTPFLRRNRCKRIVIAPPVAMPAPDPARVAELRSTHGANGGPLVGFAARFAAEKGVEFMLRALPKILESYPQACVLFAGEYANVIGERAYWQRLQPALSSAASRWKFLGVLSAEEMAAFYAACEVTVLPSINATESFGLVQVESMICGTPVVASDLPGVRVPVRTTGMGRTVPPADAAALAEAVCEVIRNRAAYIRPRAEIESRYSIPATVEAYRRLFGDLCGPLP